MFLKSKILTPLIIFTLIITSLLIAGDTYNTNISEPTMYSIEDIYALIDDTATTTKTLSPGETYGSSMNSISELYVKLANLIDETKLASPSVTYLGVTGGTTPTPVDDITKEFTPTSNSNTVTGFTLEDIYNLITNNTRPLTPSHSFAPSSGPASTMHSLNDIYTELSNLITDPMHIVTGTTYLGVVGEYTPPIVCDSPLIYDSKSYATVLIGSQCWMQENLNIGEMVTGTTTMTDNSILEKYCYDNDEANCDTYGGFYQWNEAMQYVITPGAQGICPTDWHIPTHDEFTTLERSICSSLGNTDCETKFPYNTTTRGWLGTNEGTEMKLNSGPWKGLLSGYRDPAGSFIYIGSRTTFWSSTTTEFNISIARVRMLLSNYATVYRDTASKTHGNSLRCLKD